MSSTLPSIQPPQDEPVGETESFTIQAEIKTLLADGELPVQEVTHRLRLHFPADHIIAVVTDMVRSGRVHMTESYPMRLRLRFQSRS